MVTQNLQAVYLTQITRAAYQNAGEQQCLAILSAPAKRAIAMQAYLAFESKPGP